MNNIQVECVFSSTMAKARRTQSMKPFATHTVETIETAPDIQKSGSISSISSSDSFVHVHKESDTQPIEPSTSAVRSDSPSFQEVDLRPLVEESKRVSFINNPVNLEDPSAVTHRQGRINPTRDGVFARARSGMMQRVSGTIVGTAVGTALGIAGVEISKNILHSQGVNNTETSVPISMNNTTIDSDGIVNKI